MTSFDERFAALAHRMRDLTAPPCRPTPTPSIACLIDRVDRARQNYRPARTRAGWATSRSDLPEREPA